MRQQKFDVVFLQSGPAVLAEFPIEFDQLIGVLFGRAACVVAFGVVIRIHAG